MFAIIAVLTRHLNAQTTEQLEKYTLMTVVVVVNCDTEKIDPHTLNAKTDGKKTETDVHLI